MRKLSELFRRSHPAHIARSQLRWYLLVRALIIGLFLLGALAYQWYVRGVVVSPVLLALYLLGGLCAVQIALSGFLLWRVRRPRFFIQGQVVWDLLLVTALIYVTGGIDSLFSFLYIFVIIGASLFFARRDILFVASASAILYGSLLDLQYYGYLPLFGSLGSARTIDGTAVFYSVFVNVLAFFSTALFSTILVDRLRRSEAALEKREIDYEELENLNRTILANVTSGLLIVNPEGRIRSFNQAAGRISGFSLSEVYNRPLGDVFPDFQVIDDHGFILVNRKEGSFVTVDGRSLTLGYASSLLRDSQGKILGLLVAFQDLTEFKLMEEQLKRADRLAAVGRLASGMAHEIRNPLASISGSAQLLLEGSHLTAAERRLMKIIVKEAQRLNVLLTDFLVYARPRPAQCASVDVARLLDELVEVLAGDQRFSALRLVPAYSGPFYLNVDRQQLRQALWNLAINAAEVMPAGGNLTFGILPEMSAIYVEDNGPGIPEELRGRIFEPFFTTKDKGSGLGLATVHAIVEGHGGEVRVDPGAAGGTRFTIRLPQRAEPSSVTKGIS
ncbi:two-component system sensor histidine kinase NtrB [Trichloromonas sp.]|uniref:two-component system sensor histidine kinase NtrB n=1 Tax=Trichloromonas sp. TaxID=3069249 RepID=UPI002A3AE00C|nr:ATP-binding protein [Trichloromonas sp.]